MAPSTSTSANLARTVVHAVSFLTSPLLSSYPPVAVSKLQLLLEANLTARYAPTWIIKDPQCGSSSRSLSLSPHCLPPRSIYSACVAAGVQWFDWMALLGNQELQLFVDPGCVTVYYGQKDTSDVEILTVWVDQPVSNRKPVPGPIDVRRAIGMGSSVHQNSKTLAQQLLEADHQVDDQVFAMIADEMNAPTLATPVDPHFPPFSRPLSPVSAISAHSRCSSRSSNSSSGFSYTSAHSSATSLASAASIPAPQDRKQSRRERARHARVFVDTTKIEVTPYDGGKTTVLTGGVMLGALQRRATMVKAKHIQ